MEQTIRQFITQHHELMLTTLRELCAIPAPSHAEHQRAAYCKAWLERHGATGVTIDGACNVLFPYGCAGKTDITVFAAHTDTVFPDTEPLPYREDETTVYCPGAADDTFGVVAVLLLAKFFLDHRVPTENGLLFVCNSCEEGLGNLKGTRQLFCDWAGRIGRFITFDSMLGAVNDRCVGSHRYEVEVTTAGGHSFGAFGNRNAIAELSQIVSAIYALEVPQKVGCRTTYNVGTIEGGTSVNTIAQSAKMLCEYRSDDRACLAVMEEAFARIFAAARREDVAVTVRRVGDRPCGSVDAQQLEALKSRVLPVIAQVTGADAVCRSASTDANIPQSLGIPALCVGIDRHKGIHTRQEQLDKVSLPAGLEIALRLALTLKDG